MNFDLECNVIVFGEETYEENHSESNSNRPAIRIKFVDKVEILVDAITNDSSGENDFSNVTETLINRKFKFLGCVKTPIDETRFLKICEYFFELFGVEGVSSLVIVAIEAAENHQLCSSLKKSQAYKFLLEKNSNNEIPFCLWDNQVEKLRLEIAKVKEFQLTKQNYEKIKKNIQNHMSKIRNPVNDSNENVSSLRVCCLINSFYYKVSPLQGKIFLLILNS